MVIDVRMPGMSGFEFYRQFQQMDGKANIMFLTAFEILPDEAKKVFPTLKINHFIRKPISIQELVKQLKEL